MSGYPAPPSTGGTPVIIGLLLAAQPSSLDTFCFSAQVAMLTQTSRSAEAVVSCGLFGCAVSAWPADFGRFVRLEPPLSRGEPEVVRLELQRTLDEGSAGDFVCCVCTLSHSMRVVCNSSRTRRGALIRYASLARNSHVGLVCGLHGEA